MPDCAEVGLREAVHKVASVLSSWLFLRKKSIFFHTRDENAVSKIAINWKNGALEKVGTCGQNHLVQAGILHFGNALCRKESSHLVKKRFRGSILRQSVRPPLGLHQDIRCPIIGKFSRDRVSIGFGPELVDEIPHVPHVTIFHYGACRERDSFVGKDFIDAFDVQDNVLHLDKPWRRLRHIGRAVIGWHVGKLDLDDRLWRARSGADWNDNLPSGHGYGIAFDSQRMRRLLERYAIGSNVKIALQRLLRSFQRISDDTLEFDGFDISAALSTDKIQVLAIAFTSVAKTERGAALKYDMPKRSCIR